jgi:phosphoribosylamine--glycine ligase
MHVLLIGGGGREHALAWKLRQSPHLHRLSVTNWNPGFEPCDRVEGDPVVWAKSNEVDLVVVGPEGPLEAGIVDAFAAVGIPCFGPSAAAARLESSKAFCKEFFGRAGIPTATATLVSDLESALVAIRRLGGACVVKADGLAAGKGVVVADDEESAVQAVSWMLAGGLGKAGQSVLIEERLEGPEVSVLAICDGRIGLCFPPVRDHKRRFAGDLGPNTGGMGTISPAPGVDSALLAEIEARVIVPALAQLAREGTPFVGTLFAGMMLTRNGPKTLEFNVRFGDPECQVLMMGLAPEEDLLVRLHDAALGRLSATPLASRSGTACCVVVVESGYPEAPRKGARITQLPPDSANQQVFFAGVTQDASGLLVNGGRVLGCTAWAETATEARELANKMASSVHFSGAAFRDDIGVR